MRVAYLVSRYPAVSHTFILREVAALRCMGAHIDTFSVRRSRMDEHWGPEAEYESFRDELRDKLEALVDHNGKLMGNKAHKPEEIYKTVKGVCPDLLVIFGDLHWRSVGTIGNPDVYTFSNDTGPDDANHAQQGMYILSHPSISAERRDASLFDVTPTTLRMFGMEPREDMVGTSLV